MLLGWKNEQTVTQSITHPNKRKLFRQQVHGLVQLLMQNTWLSRLRTRSRAHFNKIIICPIFISVNAIQKFLWQELEYSSHPWLWPAYVKSRFAFARTVELKGLCLQLKRSGTEYAAQKINFLTSTVANGRLLPLWKVSFGFDELLMSYYLFIFYPINMSSTWHHKFYWFWLISKAFSGTFWSETTHL